MNKGKIYIAGFDVFYLDALKRGEELKNICNKYGYEGLFPLDNEVVSSSKEDMATKIFYGNIDYIQKSDFVIANLNSFRGKEPDSGTCFECGVAYGLGKKIYGYIDNKYSLKYKNAVEYNGEHFLDENNMIVEDFDFPLNLMLSVPIAIIGGGSFEGAIKKLDYDYTNSVEFIMNQKCNKCEHRDARNNPCNICNNFYLNYKDENTKLGLDFYEEV